MSASERFFNAKSVYRIVQSLEWDDERIYKDGTFEHEWWMRAETYLGMHRQSRWDGWVTLLRAAPLAQRGEMAKVYQLFLELLRNNATQLLGFWEEAFATIRLRRRGLLNPWTGTGGSGGSSFDLEEDLARLAGLELRSLQAEIKERMDRYG